MTVIFTKDSRDALILASTFASDRRVQFSVEHWDSETLQLAVLYVSTHERITYETSSVDFLVFGNDSRTIFGRQGTWSILHCRLYDIFLPNDLIRAQAFPFEEDVVTIARIPTVLNIFDQLFFFSVLGAFLLF